MLRSTAVIALSGWALFVLMLWINASLVIGSEFGYFDGKRFPLSPTFEVTPASLALLVIYTSRPFVLIAAGFAMLIRSRRAFIKVAIALWALFALYVGWSIAFAFQIDFGATWGLLGAYSYFFYRPMLTPLLTIGSFLVWLWVIVKQRPPVVSTGR